MIQRKRKLKTLNFAVIILNFVGRCNSKNDNLNNKPVVLLDVQQQREVPCSQSDALEVMVKLLQT